MNDVEVYDLHNDPEEMNNLAVDPKRNGDLILALNQETNRRIAEHMGVEPLVQKGRERGLGGTRTAKTANGAAVDFAGDSRAHADAGDPRVRLLSALLPPSSTPVSDGHQFLCSLLPATAAKQAGPGHLRQLKDR